MRYKYIHRKTYSCKKQKSHENHFRLSRQKNDLNIMRQNLQDKNKNNARDYPMTCVFLSLSRLDCRLWNLSNRMITNHPTKWQFTKSNDSTSPNRRLKKYICIISSFFDYIYIKRNKIKKVSQKHMWRYKAKTSNSRYRALPSVGQRSPPRKKKHNNIKLCM